MEPIIGSMVHKDGVTLHIHDVQDGEVYFQKFYPGEKTKPWCFDLGRIPLDDFWMASEGATIEAPETPWNPGPWLS